MAQNSGARGLLVGVSVFIRDLSSLPAYSLGEALPGFGSSICHGNSLLARRTAGSSIYDPDDRDRHGCCVAS